MINFLIGFISDALILLGLFQILSGIIGLFKYRDFYVRLHFASLIESSATSLILFGLMMHEGANFMSLKLLIIMLFIFVTTSIAAHLLALSFYNEEEAT